MKNKYKHLFREEIKISNQIFYLKGTINCSYFYDDINSNNNLVELKYDYKVDNINTIFKFIPKIFIYSNIK